MCTPTRGQLMTGLDCLRNGAMNVSSGRALLRRGLPTMATLFSAAGYRTGQFGKWHLGDNYPYRPQDRGFEETLSFPSSHVGSAPDFFQNDYFHDTYSHNGVRKQSDGYCTDVFFQAAMTWMKGCAAKQEPFLCFLATNAPHGPLFVPAEYRSAYAGQPDQVARFLGMLANIDDNMGRLDKFLNDGGLARDTILIFLTDNGGTAGTAIFNAGLRGKKMALYDGGHRVPCFIRWPGGNLRSPGDIAELTQVQDLLPTLLDLCGVSSVGAAFDGISLAPLLRDTSAALPDRTLVVQFSRMNDPKPKQGDACVLWKKWRLVSDRELYDVAHDRQQATNVIDQHPEIAASLRTYYDRWWRGVSQRIDERESIVIGSDAENPLLLSPVDWEDVFFDQGAQVRQGLRRNGHWNVEVARAGSYEFTLRRWPVESDQPITAGIPVLKHDDGEFPLGVALPIASARLTVGSTHVEKRVEMNDKAIVFNIVLPVGRTLVRTAFLDGNDAEIAGAYYVTVRRK